VLGTPQPSADRGNPGTEPDYRFTLANERTFLARIRTSLAFFAAGVGVVQLVPSLAARPQRLAVGLALVGLALVLAGTSYRRWARVERAIRLGEPLPRSSMPLALAAGLTVVIAVAALLLVSG
jgi:putative membrane protein